MSVQQNASENTTCGDASLAESKIAELEQQILELKSMIKTTQTPVTNASESAAASAQQPCSTCECEICHRHYKNKYVLKTHMKIHNRSDTDAKPPKIDCPICHKKFCTKYYVARHIKDVHSNTASASEPSQASDSCEININELNELNNMSV